LQLQQFKGSEGTVEFIRIVDRLFGIINSRSPVAKEFKRPLHLSAQGRWVAILQNATHYQLSLKHADSQPLMHHRRKTFVIGFVTTDFTITLIKADDNSFIYLLA